MKDLHPEETIERLCGLFGYSRIAWYKKQRTIYKRAVEEQIILEKVRRVKSKMPRIGTRKLLEILRQESIQIGRDKLFEILGRNGLLVRRRRTRALTTQSFHWLRKYPNLIKEMQVNSPNQLWVSDITYVTSTKGFMYLFLITDAYSRMILGYKLSDNLKAINAVMALKMALHSQPANLLNLVHHSDRGIQYCSDEYISILKSKKIWISMTENGDPLENAIAERVNGILKDEWLYDMGPIQRDRIEKTISNVILIYNSDRPHLSIDMLTPRVAHQQSGILKRRWKNYYQVQPKIKEETIKELSTKKC
jgi:transposase InsO family protein